MNKQARKYVLIPEERYKRFLALLNKEPANTLKEDTHNNLIIDTVEDKKCGIAENLHDFSDKKSIEEILSYFPPKMKSRARLISSYLNCPNSMLSWNSIGEISNKNELIKGSSLTDLLYDACCPRRKYEPVGASIFYKGLKLSNIPAGIIRNKERQKYLLEKLTDSNIAFKQREDTHRSPIQWKKY